MLNFRRLKTRLACALAALAFGAAGAHAASKPALHVRAGLPHVTTLATVHGGVLRVAYLGGSITAADGWRPLTTAHLRSLFPKATITEINAGLPGTGSDLGVCRLERDVLRHRPDLIFVEFAVNDTNAAPAQIERTMEGIVRQARRANPRVDFCFVYTVNTPALPDLSAGRFQASALAMENVAAHYAIPSLHFGVEIAQRVAAGTLVFKAADRPDDPHTFSLDGVHPTPAGHRVYFETLQRALPALLASGVPSPTTTPVPSAAPLHADNWEHARLRPMDEITRTGDWTSVALDDPGLRGATKALLPPVWRTTETGAAVTFEFTGKKFGLLGIAAPDNGLFRVTVDDLPPVEDTFFDSFVSPTFCRAREWFYPQPLNDGPHRVRVELLDRPLDKVGIKARANRPAADPADYTALRLVLAGVLVVEDAGK